MARPAPSAATPLIPDSPSGARSSRSRAAAVAFAVLGVAGVSMVARAGVQRGKQSSASTLKQTSIARASANEPLWGNVSGLNELTCAYFDDDGRYPLANSCTSKVRRGPPTDPTEAVHSPCVVYRWWLDQDTHQCSKCEPDGSHTGDANCYDVCGTTCDFAAAGIDDVPDMVPNASYMFSCAWSSVAELRTTCNGSFAPSFPSASENESPVLDDEFRYSEYTSLDPCAVHAYCYACATSGTGGGSNAYCEAVAYFYTSSAYEYGTELDSLNGALYALNDQGYWCRDDVLDAIEAGSFTDRCDSSLSKTKAGHC